MKNKEELYIKIEQVNQKGAVELQQLVGDYDFARYVLKISRIEEPLENQLSLLVVRVPQNIAGFPQHLIQTPVGRTALEDLLTRKVADEIDQIASYDDAGLSRRRLCYTRPGQKILPRSSLVVTEEYVEARIYFRPPLQDGRVVGGDLKEMFFGTLPQIVNAALIYCNLAEGEAESCVNLMSDADHIRRLLPTRGWVSFVAERARLCRAGWDDLPDPEHPGTLAVDDALAKSLDLPKAGAVRGLGLPAGLTVILGDAYSGRIELMRAIAAGIYNHVRGDGRELIITVPDAVYLKAEPGRSVQRVDLGVFLREANPATGATYSRPHADTFASQAAATVEALEVGARALLFDESDSAPEFLARDPRVAGLTPAAEQRITPLSAVARRMVDQLGISIVVAGSSTVTDFIPVADTVLRVSNFKIYDVTKEAKKLVGASPAVAGNVNVKTLVERVRSIVPSSIDPSAGRSDFFIEATDMHRLCFGRDEIDLSGVEQLADVDQTRTIGRILYYAKTRYMEEVRPIREVLDSIDQDLSAEGLETLTRALQGDLARPRRYEIAAAINRLRSLRIARLA
jgi:predicted ABC-class ATPase